ncbi:MAG TPA: aspartate/glutamate racemase family protein [Anaerolineales bacterium]|nr:aspartate/glutamate racemase family protein [Anaerolineales bacterium]HRF48345.1 aspartate/glutamate racemase family protein [Anaerolineales bacterium]
MTTRTIGLIGGMSWESSVTYYRVINTTVRERLGRYHNARSLMLTVDFAEIEALQAQGDWATAGEILADAARRLELAGAGLVVLCTNTMHVVADQIQAAIGVPFLHIVDPTAAALKRAGLSVVGLLGTRFTMEMDFYRRRLETEHGFQVLVPEPADRDRVHEIIFGELVHGEIWSESRSAYLDVIERLAARGAEGVIFGCTEIGLLLSADHVRLPVFDTTRLHAVAAVDWALGDPAGDRSTEIPEEAPKPG